MAFSTFVSSLTVPAATGNQATSGVGFQPKVVLFWGLLRTSDGDDETHGNEPTHWGVGVSSSSRVAVTEGDDGVTSNATASDATKCIKSITGASTVVFAADLVSLDADGFTVNFTTANATAYVVNYLCLGGADLTNVFLKSFTSATSTGNVGYTGVGFQPDWIYALGADSSSNNNGTTFGLMTSSSARGTSCQAANATTGGRVQKTTKCYTMLDGATLRDEADLVSLDSDGFTWNWTTANANTHTVYALCLKGGSYKVGAFTQKTSTGTQAYTGFGFQPKGVLYYGVGRTAGAAIDANQSMMTAAASDTTHRAVIQYGAGARSLAFLSRTLVYGDYTIAGARSANALADLSSFDADGDTLNYTTADATAREVIYTAFGNAASVTAAQQIGIFDQQQAGAMVGLVWK